MEIILEASLKEFKQIWLQNKDLPFSFFNLHIHENELAELKNTLQTISKPFHFVISLDQNGSTYSQETIANRQTILQDLWNVPVQYLEYEYPFDLPSVEKLAKGHTRPIITFKDLEGIAKIDFSMIQTLARSLPNSIFKIVANPETVLDLHQLVMWGKTLTSRGIPHVIEIKGVFSQLQPFMAAKYFGNHWLSISFDQKPLQNQARAFATRIQSDFEHLGGVSTSVDERDIVFDKLNMLLKSINSETYKVGILSNDPFLMKIKEVGDNELFNFLNFNGISVSLPVSTNEEISAFLKGLVQDLFDGYSLIGSIQKTKFDVIDRYDVSSAKSGVVSFISNMNGYYNGFDTNYYLFKEIIEEHLQHDVVNVYLEGVSTLTYSLLPIIHPSANQITIRNRTKSKISNLVQYYPKVSEVEPGETVTYDLVVNFVPFGTGDLPSILPFSRKVAENARMIIDTTLTTNDTPLIRFAKKYDIPYVDGLQLFAKRGFIDTQILLESKHSS